MNAATTAPALGSHRSGPFTKRTVLALVIASFLAFLALLALIGAGQTSRQSNDGGSHASANGLNGYSGLVELLRIRGEDVTISRSPSGFNTDGLLVLTPPMNAEAEDIQQILDDRYYTGPTLIILPKWFAQRVQDDITDDVRVEDGWVNLLFTAEPDWIENLDAPYGLTVTRPWIKTPNNEDAIDVDEIAEELPDETRETVEEVVAIANAASGNDEELPKQNWSGLGLSGDLPDGRYVSAASSPAHSALITAEDGTILASSVMGEEDSDFFIDAYPVTIIVEPDLANNYGLADRQRAAATVAIVQDLTYDWTTDITFDVSLNGLGGSENLLTLAFRPPFLAATLCLILALVIVGWRAFIRFGPAVAESRAIAFGKRRLVSNGAGLILRARRLRLLADPYIALTTRRIGRRLGIRRATTETISETLALRFPQEQPLIDRAAALRNAKKPKEILRAARALKDLERKLEK